VTSLERPVTGDCCELCCCGRCWVCCWDGCPNSCCWSAIASWRSELSPGNDKLGH